MNDREVLNKAKEKTKELIEMGDITFAKELIEQYKELLVSDVEVYSMRAVIAMIEEDLEEAKKILLEGYQIDNKDCDLLFNLAYTYESMEEFDKSLSYYEQAKLYCLDTTMDKELESKIKNIKRELGINCVIENKTKMVFFVKKGMDSFLNDIIDSLSVNYDVKKITISHNDEFILIDQWMEWADICWFEWCDELIVYGSRLELAQKTKIICRLHSYEAFESYPGQVLWETVDKLIFVAEHLKEFLVEHYGINERKAIVIPNGVNLDKWTFAERKPGFKIAYVGYINYKKGPMLLLHTFKELYDKDSRYNLYIAGKFQDYRDTLYFKQMIKEFGIEDNVHFDNWQNDLDKWLEDKNYILCTSILESQNMSIMQAMAKGIKPIIHNFVGAKGIYNSKYVWNTISEAVSAVLSLEYDSYGYRIFINNNYNKNKIIDQISIMINSINYNNVKTVLEKPLITIGVPNYNYSRYLDSCLESIFNQTYNNIEIIIVDDKSSDDSVDKIKRYEKMNKGVKGIYHEENTGGCLVAFNEILENARGEYVFFLSADDYLASNDIIEVMLGEFDKQSELDYVYGNFNLVNEYEESIGKWEYKQFGYREIIVGTFNRGGSAVMPLTAGLYKMDYYKRNHLKFTNDKVNILGWDALHTLINLKYNIQYQYINKEVLSYRQHNSNMTYNLGDRIPSIISNMEYIINNFDSKVYLDLNKFDNISEEEVDYRIIKKYFEEFHRYASQEWMPFGNQVVIEKDKLRVYINPLVKIIREYIDRLLERTNGYTNELNNMLEILDRYIKEN